MFGEPSKFKRTAMNTSFQRINNSQEWHTPHQIIEALGHFDLDPSPSGDRFLRLLTRSIQKKTMD